jgi:wobble nucleotide-excising tRNase
MIESITVHNDASYANAQPFNGLKQINFVYGANGSGKTTISRIIADQSASPRSMIHWKNGKPLETLVYNSDFVARTFVPQMKGIFTLGEESAETLQKIEDANGQVNDYWTVIGSLRTALGIDDNSGKRGELTALRVKFEEHCWGIKSRHDQHFKGAFEGLRGRRSRFCDRVLQEHDRNSAALTDLDSLKERAITVYQDALQQLPFIPCPSFDNLATCESASILSKRIVGKEDVDIAALIRRLGSSDWVKAGMVYLQASGDQCPFCQQRITSALSEQLNEYFDETYLREMAVLNSLAENYRASSKTALSRLDELLLQDQKHVHEATLQAESDRLRSRISANQELIERKQREPSSVVALEPTAEIVAAISRVIANANANIDRHNALVANHATEKQKLTTEIWRFLLEEEKADIKAYLDDKSALDKAIEGMSKNLSKKRAAHAESKNALAELEKSITSVQPTVNEINTMLESFGFAGFKLKTAGENDHLYEIVREDGSDAHPTLSEGEKSFVTFLYFYNLIRGSHTESGMIANRVVVFDDPVSSLDSDVLFIVSALVKRVMDEAKSTDGLVKQVFVLTHNTYFHKEVSFDPKRKNGKCQNNESFWIVRKIEKASTLKSYDHNPIKTSYELLWNEVRSPERSNIAIQNTLRRILENYFTILGNRDKDAIIGKFDGKERQICASLFSWVNDGSHSAHDDCYVSLHEGQIDRYLTVFKRVFEVIGHIAHYNMMMGTEEAVDAPAAAVRSVSVAAA